MTPKNGRLSALSSRSTARFMIRADGERLVAPGLSRGIPFRLSRSTRRIGVWYTSGTMRARTPSTLQ